MPQDFARLGRAWGADATMRLIVYDRATMRQPPTKMLTYVVTGNARQFQDYCRENGLNIEACRFVLRPDTLLLAEPADQIVFCGEYEKHPRIAEIRQILAARRAA